MPKDRATRKIRFNKSTDAFNIGARIQLERIALPKDSGLYLGPQPKSEILYSDLVPVRAFPLNLLTASTSCESRKEAFQLFPITGERPPQSWTVHGHIVYSFENLNDKLWERICDPGTIEEHETLDLAKTENPAIKRVFVELLNLTLKEQLRDQDLIFYEPERYFYEKPDPQLNTKKTQYSSRSKRSSRATFKGYQSSKEPATQLFYRHAGFYGNFLRFDQKWFLQIAPTYHFTTDGGRISPFAASAMAGIKRLENNQAVHGQVIMWARRLQQQSKWDSKPKKIFFTEPLQFDSAVGFDDEAWLTHDLARQKELGNSELGTVTQ